MMDFAVISLKFFLLAKAPKLQVMRSVVVGFWLAAESFAVCVLCSFRSLWGVPLYFSVELRASCRICFEAAHCKQTRESAAHCCLLCIYCITECIWRWELIPISVPFASVFFRGVFSQFFECGSNSLRLRNVWRKRHRESRLCETRSCSIDWRRDYEIDGLFILSFMSPVLIYKHI